jgi:hypothetical protein
MHDIQKIKSKKLKKNILNVPGIPNDNVASLHFIIKILSILS